MPARNVSLTDHFETFIDDSVASGRYQNASEVVREGLRLLEQRNREDALKLSALQAAIDVGLDDEQRGRVVSIRDDELDAFLSGLGRSGAAAA